jgi:hypothetical protein
MWFGIRSIISLPRNYSHDRFHGGGLAGAVAPQQGNDLAFPDLEIDTVQDMAFAIPGIQAVYLKHGGAQTSAVPR